MIESDDDLVINQVKKVLQKYPTKDELFANSKKIVLVLDDNARILYNHLKRKYSAKNKLLVQNVVEADNATFVFYNNLEKLLPAIMIAEKIYLRKVIFDQPIEAKVLSADYTSIDFCKNCSGYYYCPSPSNRPCFAGDRPSFKTLLDNNFFKLFGSKIEFEMIDLRLYE
jgi:hypothetical protein